MRYLILIITLFLFTIIAKANENNFFNESKDLFEKEKYEDSKFLFHRNLSISDQIKEIRKVKAKKMLVGAAVGASLNEHIRAQKILKKYAQTFAIKSHLLTNA